MTAIAARPTIAIVGGTGPEGSGLALRLAAAGYRVLVGSRSAARAEETVRGLLQRLADRPLGHAAGMLEGHTNAAAITEADIVFLCLPYPALAGFLAETAPLLAGKILVDVVVPLELTNGHVDLLDLPARSASTQLQAEVPESRVVAGFKNLSAVHLLAIEEPAEGDVLLASDDPAAKVAVTALVRAIPDLRPVDAGPLANAGFLESLTALEINMNRLHKARTGIRILGLG